MATSARPRDANAADNCLSLTAAGHGFLHGCSTHRPTCHAVQ
jgi:hypothetical protein